MIKTANQRQIESGNTPTEKEGRDFADYLGKLVIAGQGRTRSLRDMATVQGQQLFTLEGTA